MPPEILAKIENDQIKIFREEEKSNLGKRQTFDRPKSTGDYMQGFQTNFHDKTSSKKNVEYEEISKLKQENTILNKILSNFFPENKSVVKRDYNSPTIAPIFKTTSRQPTILFPSNHRYNNKFIVPTQSSAQNCLPYSCQEPKPSRFDYNFDVQPSRVKDVPSSDHKSFHDFSSLEEIKQVLRDDPSFFTRLQGLENLRKTSPHSYSRSLKSKLGKVMAGRTNREHLEQILSRRFRRDAEEMILKRPAIFDKIKDKDGKTRSGLEAPSVNSPVQEYSLPSDTSPPPVLYNSPSEFYNPPTENEPPSEFYSVPGSDLPLVNFTSQNPAPNNPRDPVPVSEVAPPVAEVAPPPVDAPSSSVESSDTVLQTPAAIASQDVQTSEDIPVAIDLPLASVIASSVPSSSSSSSSTSVLTGFDRNSALLTAFGLSLIPTLAISIPFLAPAFRRRGRVTNAASNYSYSYSKKQRRKRRRGEDANSGKYSHSWQ